MGRTLDFDRYYLNFSLSSTSMGGAIAVRVAAAGVVPLLVGLVVIDVVEGKCTPRCHKVYSRKRVTFSHPFKTKPRPFFLILYLLHACLISGTAIDSLGSMHSFLRGRPSSFKSVEHAIEWR